MNTKKPKKPITELIKDVGLNQSAIKRINQRLHLYLFPTLKP